MQLPYYEKMQGLLRRTVRSLQIDTDRSFLLEMNSDGNVRISGITDIKGYDENRILVISRKYVTEIKGNCLFMHKFSDTEIYVSGDIVAINFIKR